MIEPNNHTNENTACLKSSLLSPWQKNKKQKSISDLVMSTKRKNESIDNNDKRKVQDGNEKNTTCNRRIKYATTTTINNNHFTTKCTLNIRPEKNPRN